MEASQIETTPSQAITTLVVRFKALGEAQLNEANTRVQFITEMLTRVLGWSIEELSPEEYAPSAHGEQREWLDNHVRSGESLKLVVEAKKVGKTFSLPAARKPRVLPLKQLISSSGPELRAAIKQAQTYCVSVGTYAFAVTNGHQWVASLAFANNVPADRMSAVVFYGLDDIAANLQEFIDLLSPDGMAAQILMSRATSGGAQVPTFAKRVNDKLPPGVPAGKNYLVTAMAQLMRICFGDLTDADHQRMLAQCYVTTEASDEYLRLLDSFVGANLPIIVAGAPKVYRSAAGSVSETMHAGGVVLVVGRAGSGKSTFLAYARQRFIAGAENRVVLHADLLRRTETHAKAFNHDRLVSDVCTDLLVQASESYPDLNPYEHALLCDVFSGEIKRLTASLSSSARVSVQYAERVDALVQEHLKDPATHLKAYLGFLERRGTPATVVLDNLDRGTEEFERVVFQLGQTLAHNTSATVVVSLRDTTYEQGKNNGFLDVARHTAVTLSPPPFVDVAQKRFQYAQTQLRDDDRLARQFSRALNGIDAARALDFASIMADVVLGGNREIQACIQALAGTNIRTGLGFLEDFATSPHTDVDKIFGFYRQAERKRLDHVNAPIDVFLRSVMRMSSMRYEEKRSRIANVFQASPKATTSHFIAIRILQMLASQVRLPREVKDLTTADVVAALAQLGHGAQRVSETLNHLGRYGLIGSTTRAEPPWSAGDVVRISASGHYYLRELMFQREYLKNVLDDTILYEERTFDSIMHAHQDKTRQWPERADDKARAFLVYLTKREQAELQQLGAPQTRPEWLVPIAEELGTRSFGRDFLRQVHGRGAGRRSSSSRPPPTSG